MNGTGQRMAQQVAASLALLTPRYANPAAREESLLAKEPDFITPPREGFPSILRGLWISSAVCMCEDVGWVVECVFVGRPASCCGVCG